MPQQSIARILAAERAKILKALKDLALLKPELVGRQRQRLEEIEETLRRALMEK